MNKFILIGGYPHKATDGGKALCEELVKGFPKPIRLLDCLFARPQENWEEAFKRDEEFFTRNLPGVTFQIELAQPDTFLTQLQNTNAVYFRGGNTPRLLALLDKTPDWKNHLEEKTIAGTSAGMDMLASYCFNIDTLQIEDGLGLLRIKTIPHWMSDYNAPNVNWEAAKQSLSQYKEDFPLVTLREGEFKIFEIQQ